MTSGAIGKFRLNGRNSISRSSSIPRLSMSHGIKKRNNQTATNKSTSKLPSGSVSTKSEMVGKKEQQKESKQEKVFNPKLPERKVLSNLSNSPIVLNRPKCKTKETKEPTFGKQSVIKFDTDPSSLTNILNNQPIEVRKLNEQKGYSIAGDMLFYPDGRPSLCRRVPIVRNSLVNGRPSISAPGRVLSTKKAKPQKQFLQSSTNSRHSLYSVVQGRYSQAPENKQKIQIGRQSLQQGRKPTKSSKIVNELNPLPFKSPPPQRILSRRNEVRTSASPALRVPCPIKNTPPAQRIIKKERKPVIRWADENDQVVQKKLVEFNTSPSPPHGENSKIITKTPVSILKSRKHTKRNSLTPPVVKKNKKTDLEDDCTIEIINPHFLNEFKAKIHDVQSPDIPNIKSETVETHSPKSPIIKKQEGQIESPTLIQKSPKPPIISPTNSAVTKEKVHQVTQQKVVDGVLDIMTQQISKVKRKSIQAEMLNLYQQVAQQFKVPESIAEENESVVDDHVKGVVPDVTVTQATEINPPIHNSTPVSKDDSGPPKSPSNQVNSVLTPENMNKLQQSYEETNKSLGNLALRTEEINRELYQLQLDKEKLKALRNQVNLKKGQCQILTNKDGASPNLKSSQPSSPDDIISLDRLVCVDLKKGALEFQKATESPILSAKIEFAPRTSPKSAPPNENKLVPNSPSAPQTNSSAAKGDAQDTGRELKSLTKAANPSLECTPDIMKSYKDIFNSKDIVKQVNLGDGVAQQTQPSQSSVAFNYHGNKENVRSCPEPQKSSLLWPQCSNVDRRPTKTQTESEKTCHVLTVNYSITNSSQKASNGLSEFSLDSCSTSGGILNRQTTVLPHDTEKRNNVMSKPPGWNNNICFSDALFHGKESDARNLHQTFPDGIQHAEPNDPLPQTNLVTKNMVDSTPSATKAKAFATMATASKPTSKTTDGKLDDFLRPLPKPDVSRTCTINPQPLRFQPFQTPKVFRELQRQVPYKGSALYRESPKSKMKQQFTQALLDEEVALLTCRIVKPPCSAVHSKPIVDPVATSLSTGDDTHFVPIVQTPALKKKPSVKTGSGSAFSSYSAFT